jgi:hypothetical protein
VAFLTAGSELGGCVVDVDVDDEGFDPFLVEAVDVDGWVE